MYEHPNGKVEGRRIAPFSYTQQTILPEVEWQRKIQVEISRVKKLAGDKHGNKGQWTEKVRNGRIFAQDRLSCLNGIGPAVEKRLNEHGLATIKDLLDIKNDENKKKQAIRDVKGLTKNTFERMYAQLHDVHEGKCPPNIDHTRHEHPYKSLWKDHWEEKMTSSATLSAYTSIYKLIAHMFTETEKAFAGSKHEKTWLIYHDALKLMTGKDAVDYMKQKGWYDRLIRPKLGLNKGTLYKDRTVGCRPELQVMDYHLNQDIHTGVDEHSIITRHLNDDDPLKFSLRTPKAMLSAYLRIWDLNNGIHGYPSAARIEEDINRLVDKTYLRIVSLRGISLPEVMYSGRRKHLVGRRGGHGGKRVKGNTNDKKWVHPSVSHLDERHGEESKRIWDAKMESTESV